MFSLPPELTRKWRPAPGLLTARFCAVAALSATVFCCSSASSEALTVTSGSVSSAVTPNLVTHLWADAPPPNTVFDRWVGATESLVDPYAWHTLTNAPTDPGTVTATYKPVPAWATEYHIMNGLPETDPNAVRVTYYFPKNMVGVIFFFHGAGGSGNGFFYNNVENFAFANEAVAAGYAVVGLDSLNRTTRSWSVDTTASNPDVLNVQTAVNYFISLGLMNENTPKFSTGMSNGGQFAPKPAFFLNFQGCAIWCASGQPSTIFSETEVPTIWNLAQQDDRTDHLNFLSASTRNLTTLTANGSYGELRENAPSPVYPRRFMRISQLLQSDSQLIYDDLKAGGFLDPNDYLLRDPNTSNWQSALSATYTTLTTSAILEQLTCCYGAHKFYSDNDNKVLQFFGALREPRPGVGAISNLTQLPNGTAKITVAAEAGPNYRIEASTDLVNWASIFMSAYTPGTFDYYDNDAPGFTQRFYRSVIESPIP